MVIWFWKVLESFSNEERIQFLRFVSGRTRMPVNPADIPMRFQIISSGRVSVIIINMYRIDLYILLHEIFYLSDKD